MGDRSGLLKHIALALTTLWIRLKRGSELLRTETYTVENDEEEVLLVDSESSFAGKVNSVGVIVLNEQRFKGLPDFVREYVFLHEYSHQNRHPILKAVLIVSLASSAFGGLLLFVTLQLLLTVVSQGNAVVAIPPLALSIILIGAFPAMNNLEELLAELSALRAVGEKTYLEANNELSKTRNYSLGDRIAKALFYREPETVVRLNRFLSRWHLTPHRTPP